MNNSGTGRVGNHFGNAAEHAWQFFSHLRCQPLLIIAAACLIIGEQYPLSTFPMYSSFGPSTYYLYLADGTGAPIACIPTMGLSTATLKKVFSSEMRKEVRRLHPHVKRLNPEEKRALGERFLADLRDGPAARLRPGPRPEGLRLYEVDIALRGGRFEKETIMIAEVR